MCGSDDPRRRTRRQHIHIDIQTLNSEPQQETQNRQTELSHIPARIGGTDRVHQSREPLQLLLDQPEVQ